MPQRHPASDRPDQHVGLPVPSSEARSVLEGFAAGARSEIEAGLIRGVPFATMLDDAVVWVHPDGTVRSGSSADSSILRR